MICFNVKVSIRPEDLEYFIAEYLACTDGPFTKSSFESWLREELEEHGKNLATGRLIEEGHTEKAHQLFKKWYGGRKEVQK